MTEDERPNRDDNSANNDRVSQDVSAGLESTAHSESSGVEEARRTRRSVFFRPEQSAVSPVADYPVEHAGRLTPTEADRLIRSFLTRLASGRQLEFRVDPVEMARENDLLLLFGPDEEEEFARLALSFPDETVKRWATLLSGGNRSEAFGPRSRAERRDEAAIGRELQSALLRRVFAAVLVLAFLAAGSFGVRALLGIESDDASGPGLRFAQPTLDQVETTTGTSVVGGPPIAEPALTAVADRIVAVVKGDEPIADRIRLSVPARELPIGVGSVAAAVFQYDRGQIALMGPEGWVDASCVRVSVTTEGLRPLDVVRHEGLDANCPDEMVGRDSQVTCLGSSVLILGIEIPQREDPKELPEGGVGWAEKVRFGVERAVAENGIWEILAVRGTIQVPVGEEDVVIPRFGGRSGDQLTVNLGPGDRGPRIGTCRLR